MDPYFEELIVTRVRRQTPTFVSDDDEKVADGSGFDEIEMPSGSAPSPTDWGKLLFRVTDFLFTVSFICLYYKAQYSLPKRPVFISHALKACIGMFFFSYFWKKLKPYTVAN